MLKCNRSFSIMTIQKNKKKSSISNPHHSTLSSPSCAPHKHSNPTSSTTIHTPSTPVTNPQAHGLGDNTTQSTRSAGIRSEAVQPPTLAATTTSNPALPQAHADDTRTYAKFDDMGLSDDILRGIYAYGFEAPSTIQQRAIVPICRGGDVIMQAQSGTGKTAAFGIGILHQVRLSNTQCQALILSPTRELAQQTETVIAALGERVHVRTHCAVGGASVADDLSMLRTGVHVLCGTPGRIWSHIEQGKLKTASISTIVLDEVDEMLSAGFLEQVRAIFQAMPASCQAVAVSATFTEQVLDTIDLFMRSPTRILLPPEEVPLKAIQQFYADCGKPVDRFGVLCDIYEHLSVSQTVVFCNTRTSAEQLAQQMQEADFAVSVIHSDLSPQERTLRMREFRRGSTRVLIATNIIARGIDVQHVSIVVNFDIPRDPASYIHRIGRGGRHGRKGTAINLATNRDAQALQDIEQHYSIEIKELPMDFPTLLA
jgi:superfamily II DNA/RNA helicase